nr:leucine-rich repeat domain-containing protein [uncultured Schaedlerella sp.]
MRIHYRLLGDSAEIVRCRGTVSKVALPEQIHGYPVKKVAPYAFSAKKGEEDRDTLVYESPEDALFREHERLLAGNEVEEVIFPDTVEEIGNYIFYNCKRLKRLEFTDALVRLGSGAFTGCGNLELVRVHLKRGKKSCVKEILGDLWQRIDVQFFHEGVNAGEDVQEVKLVFPEHYEEAVENTPARILFTQHHGIGNNYRQCFYSREMDYRKYDGLFPLAVAQDRPEVAADLAFSRLLYPCGLTSEYREMYEIYVGEHPKETARHLVSRDQPELLQCMSGSGLWSRDILEEAILMAAEEGKTEMLSYLMNEKHLLFPEKKRRRFEL